MPAQANHIAHDPCVQTDSQQPMLHQDFQISVMQKEFFLMKVLNSACQLWLHIAYAPTKDWFLQDHFPSGPVHRYAEFLPQSCDPRGYIQPAKMIEVVTLKIIQSMWARPDQAHLSSQYVAELW